MANFIERALADLAKATVDNTAYLARIESALQQEQLEKVAAQVITTAYYLPLSDSPVVKLGAATVRRASVSLMVQGGNLLVSSATFDPVAESDNYHTLITTGVGDARDSKVLYIPASTSFVKFDTTGDLFMAAYCPTGQAAGAMIVNVVEAVFGGGLPSGHAVTSAWHEASKNALK